MTWIIKFNFEDKEREEYLELKTSWKSWAIWWQEIEAKWRILPSLCPPYCPPSLANYFPKCPPLIWHIWAPKHLCQQGRGTPWHSAFDRGQTCTLAIRLGLWSRSSDFPGSLPHMFELLKIKTGLLQDEVEQDISTLPILTFGARWALVLGGYPVHFRMFGSIPGFYPLDTSSATAPNPTTIKNVSRHCQMTPGGKTTCSWEPLRSTRSERDLWCPKVIPGRRQCCLFLHLGS